MRTEELLDADRIELADELLTVEDVAALFRVPKSWVYERTRRRGADRLPFIKLGKYVRFEEQSLRQYLASRRKSA